MPALPLNSPLNRRSRSPVSLMGNPMPLGSSRVGMSMPALL